MPTILEPRPPDPATVLRAQIKALTDRVALLEKGYHVPLANGTPNNYTSPSATGDGKDGSLAGDKLTNKLYLRIGGVWRSVTLT